MHGSSSTRSGALSREQTQQLGAYRAKWAMVRLGPGKGERAAAEAGARLAYQAGGLPPPAEIVWCAGPGELISAWHEAQARSQGGINVRGSIIDSVRARANTDALKRLDGPARVAVAAGARDSVAENACTEVLRAVALRLRTPRRSLRVRTAEALYRVLRWRDKRVTRLTFERAATSSYEMGWLAAHDFLDEVCGLKAETEPLRGLMSIAANAGWMVPHEHVCWLSERHTTLSYDDRGRLHNSSAPALAFADGWATYAWKGIEVPSDAILQPEAITIEQIDLEPDIFVRRCLIEIMTPQRFVAAGGAHRAERDEAGTLWRKTWWSGDSWTAVEVVDGTPGPDGLHKHYFLQVPPEVRSPRAAVAWTYGISEQDYKGLLLRT